MNITVPTPAALLHAVMKHLTFLPDSWYMKYDFRMAMGYRLNLRHPRTFNEKIQWIKFYERNPLMHTFADKYTVKQYLIEKLGGDEHVIPSLGAWDSFDDIDFDSLPDSFVLKANNSGVCQGVIICRDKATFDKGAARDRLNAALAEDLYTLRREWAYKGMRRRIIAEKLLNDSDGGLKDYKLFCCNGEPRFFSVDYDRWGDHRSMYLDMQWRRLPFNDPGLKAPDSHTEPVPEGFDRMLEIARKLSEGFTFLRVDLYNVEGRIYVGELTCYPGGGCHRFEPAEADIACGEYLRLPT